jgi:hypothetical protein
MEEGLSVTQGERSDTQMGEVFTMTCKEWLCMAH